MTDTLRTFVAVQLPLTVSDAVGDVQHVLRRLPAMRGLRWVPPQDAHFTLKFLGDTPIAQLPPLVDALDRVAERWEPFTVQLEGLGVFPNVHRPNVLWLGVAVGGKPFQHLYNAVEVALKRLAIPPERKEFHPHLTLARVPKSWSAAQQQAMGDLIGTTDLPSLPSFTVEALALMRSTLTPQGSVYKRLGNSRFGASPPLQEDDWEDEE